MNRVTLPLFVTAITLAKAAVGDSVNFDDMAAGQPLTLVGAIGLEGRIDHLAVDTASQRLYVAALGNNTVEVLDIKGNSHVKSLPGFREPQGIAVVSGGKVVAVANGHGEGVQFVDAADFHPTRAVRLGDDSDNVRYDPAAHHLFVGFGSGALASINPADGKVLGEASHRLFLGCRRPAKVLVYDTTTGKGTGSFDIVGDTDDLFFDAARKRLYVSGGEGYIDVFQDQDAGRFGRIAHIATAPGARTSLFVPEQSRLYLAVPHRENQNAEIRIYEAR